MLGKLLKHEFKATGRIMGVLYAVVAILAAYLLGSYYYSKGNATNGQMIAVSLLILIAACSFIMTTVVMVSNFQKTLYGDQGYLSFTLPVKSTTLLASKVITSTVWFLLAFVCLMGSMVIVYKVAVTDFIGEEGLDAIDTIFTLITNGKSITTIVTWVLIKLITLFISFTAVTIALYFAITLANTRLFQPHHVAWIVAFIIAISFIMSRLSSLISGSLIFGLRVSGNGFSLVTSYDSLIGASMYIDFVSPIVYIVLAVALFTATHYLMSKKVNIR